MNWSTTINTSITRAINTSAHLREAFMRENPMEWLSDWLKWGGVKAVESIALGFFY
jgi:hypothetical protein